MNPNKIDLSILFLYVLVLVFAETSSCELSILIIVLVLDTCILNTKHQLWGRRGEEAQPKTQQ